MGALPRLTPPCTPPHLLAPLYNPSKHLYNPVRPLTPPYRHKGLDCVALEQAIGEGRAAALAPAELVAAEVVLEKARAAEKVKCEKDLREKMKARLLTVAILTMPMLTSHGRRLTLPAQPLGPHCTPLGPSLHPLTHPLRPYSLQPPGPTLRSLRPLTALPQARPLLGIDKPGLSKALTRAIQAGLPRELLDQAAAKLPEASRPHIF